MEGITYSVGKSTNTEGRARRSYLLRLKDDLLATPDKTVNTLYDIVLHGARSFPADKPALGQRTLLRVVEESKTVVKNIGGVKTEDVKTWTFNELSPYTWITYLELLNLTTQIGAGLLQLGMGKGDKVYHCFDFKVTIFHSTSPEWLTMAHACYSQSMTIATSYDNLGTEALAFSLNECEVSTIFTQVALLSTIKKIGTKVPTLKNIIYTGTISAASLAEVEAAVPQFKFFSLTQVQEMGRLNPAPANPPLPDDLCCIMYTSGSTGNPKGVMLTHKNMVAAVAGAVPVLSEAFTPSSEKVYLAYLPLAHVLEFTVEHTCLYYGFQLGFGSPRTLTDSSVRNCKGDIRELRPTFMAGVPAVWETIRKGVQSKLSSASDTQKYLFEKAYKLKRRLMVAGLPYHFMDKAIFAKIQDVAGGRLKLALSGGAPMAAETQEFLNVTLCAMVQGYGMTESCGLIAIQPIGEKAVYGIVGAPAPCAEIKLVQSGTYNPNPSNGSLPSGEVWVRGAHIMKGYYKQEKLTSEALTEDGWLMTGDIGEWRNDGALAIIDRKKNLVKLSHGEYVALEKLEAQYKTSKYVTNMMIYADPLKSHIIAIVTPNEVETTKLATSLGTIVGDFGNKALVAAIAKDFLVCAVSGGFKGAEILKAFVISDIVWSPENLLTAAQKLDRKAIAAHYSKEITALYID